jgi:pimeloyl-ACP methyl ester carboxylesterase
VPTGAKLVVVEICEVLVDGSRTPYRVVGAGTAVVLVHGLSGSWRWWEPVLEPLAEHHRVHLLDLPRLGRRLRAGELTGWLGRWLEAAELEGVDLIGHSLGGLIAAELAAEQPDRVHRLALVAPAGIPCGNTMLSRSARLLGTLYDVRGRMPTIARDAMRAGPFSLIRGALFASHRDLSAELASVQAPTLLIWGEDDRLLPARIAAEWQRVLPGSRLVRLHCGHVPMWEAPRELASHLLGFFGEEPFDDPGDEVGLGVVHGVRLTWNDDELTAGH